MGNVPTADFPSIAFQATLGTASLLLVVFGVLYTVFATLIGQVVNKVTSEQILR